MSYQESAAYRLQKQEQERIQREQARQSAEASYKSLRAQYEEMVRKGYSGYVPDEMARLWSALEGINKQIGKDPYGARDACYSLGNEIPAVGRLAEAAIREFQAEEARRREYLEHARKSAESFYRRYEAQYEEMARKGYAGYIPDKMEQLRNDLQTVREQLVKDPAAARDTCYGIGKYISSFARLEKNAEKEAERAEAVRREEERIERQRQQEEARDAYYAAVASIKSPVAAGFAQGELAEIQKKLSGMTAEDVRRAVENAALAGERKAEQWKQETMRKQSAAAAREALKSVREQIASKSIEDRAAGAALMAQIDALERDVAEGRRSAEDALKDAEEAARKSDELLVSEAERRQVVVAIAKELRAQGFSVARPTLEQGGFVKILAQRQSGERAECHIDAHGKMQYCFDRYPAMACMKDIKRFHADLSKAYGISFSDERVLWENPDRLSADGFSYSAPDQQGGNA